VTEGGPEEAADALLTQGDYNRALQPIGQTIIIALIMFLI